MNQMDAVDQKRAAREFVERWERAEGREKSESNKLWIELLQGVLGIDTPTKILDFERNVKGRNPDVYCEDRRILIENKSRGVGLDKKNKRSKKTESMEDAYEQAKWYADNLPNPLKPNWIITCDFDEFRFYNMCEDDPERHYISLTLEELPDHLDLFRIFTDDSNSRIVKERELSVEAGRIVARLYNSLATQFHNLEVDRREQESLNVLIVRLVFLLYAEDAGLLQNKHALARYLEDISPDRMRSALQELFEVLDTPEDERSEYLSDELKAFPYVNGGLFSRRDIEIPHMTDEVKSDLIQEASDKFDWHEISPTIFGAIFESTLNPATRHEGGMHYTSIENIHKVIDPLFLDDLKEELNQIEGIRVKRDREFELRRFQRKLASINVLDIIMQILIQSRGIIEKCAFAV